MKRGSAVSQSREQLIIHRRAWQLDFIYFLGFSVLGFESFEGIGPIGCYLFISGSYFWWCKIYSGMEPQMYVPHCFNSLYRMDFEKNNVLRFHFYLFALLIPVFWNLPGKFGMGSLSVSFSIFSVASYAKRTSAWVSDLLPTYSSGNTGKRRKTHEGIAMLVKNWGKRNCTRRQVRV